MARAASFHPMSEINTTPLIDVMLVLLVMLILTVPLATNSLDMDLPGEGGIDPNPVVNKVVITSDNRILWNGQVISPDQLSATARLTAQLPIEPELQFEPEAGASYAISVEALNRVKAAGVTKLGFVGNERFRAFGARE